MIATLFTSSLIGYMFAKFEFPGKKALFLAFILAIMIPGEVTLMGVFHMLLKVKMYDTLTALLAGYLPAAGRRRSIRRLRGGECGD
jgi:ABC-type glycerol-3-phosphate transport system permease component